MVSYASFTPTTSKYSHSNDMHAFPESFGFKREALSSISDISLLDIVLKLTGGQTDINGKCLYLGVDDCRQNVGTTVIVRDVFYNQPVRRKQMHSNPKKVLHSLKESLLFQIIEIESENDLCCTRASLSPCLLLSSICCYRHWDLLCQGG
ncbi:hypothetical protein AABB24_002437 [Solanum stoloniferum]|uniref:Uncharacterized protein n=1 Tax=Solanum stoloniferum TaxID=62892 RepID=A0ABD2VR86_9SOLN